MSDNNTLHHNHSQEDDHTHEHATEHAHEENGFIGQLRHFFKPHSHDGADSIDDALEGSKEGMRAVRNSLFVLGGAAILQLIVFSMSGSIALLADTIHNFADASTAIPLWFAFSLGKKAANKRYTYGFGRAEDIAGIFVIVMIAGSSLLAFWEAFQRLFQPQPVTNLLWVAIAAFIGFLGNEIVAQYRIRTGNKIGSAALIADGYHARTDGFTSLAVLIGAAGVWLGFPQADPIVGMLITVVIAFVLKDAVIQVWHRLMDAVDPEILEKVTHDASHVAGVEKISNIRMRWVGHTLQAEGEIIVNEDLPLSRAHDIAEEVRHAMLHAEPKLSKVIVHVDPCGHSGKDPHVNLSHHNPTVVTG